MAEGAVLKYRDHCTYLAKVGLYIQVVFIRRFNNMDSKLGDLYNVVFTIGPTYIQVICRAGLTIYICILLHEI